MFKNKGNLLIPSGFHPEDTVDKDHYGTSLNIYKWSTRELQQVIDLGPEGCAPLEIRFLHDPKAAQGFVGCALHANVYRYEICTDFCYTFVKLQRTLTVDSISIKTIMENTPLYLYFLTFFVGSKIKGLTN